MSAVETDAYQETVDYLFSRLPMFSKYGKEAIKPGLDNICALCAALNNPQEKLRCIHIAGTNGKGSTAHMLASALQAAGYKTGLYTSPHLIDFRERIKIDGVEIPKEQVVRFTDAHKQLFEQQDASFFEVTVAMAFWYFEAEACDFCVIETGLGGRLDSTNIINPILSIITNISFDHTDLLGDSLAAIAAEKAGIIKQDTPFIVGEQQSETQSVFFEHSIKKNATSLNASSQWGIVKTGEDATHLHLKAIQPASGKMLDIRCDLKGAYQTNNIKTVLTAAEVLQAMGFRVSAESAAQSFADVKKRTGLQGRWETLREKPLIIADVAHNPAGLKTVLQQWNALPARRKAVVVGFVKDKDVRSALSLFSKTDAYFFCQAQIPRALPVGELAALAAELGFEGQAFATVTDAVKAAVGALADDDALLICGSFFIVGEAKQALNTI